MVEKLKEIRFEVVKRVLREFGMRVFNDDIPESHFFGGIGNSVKEETLVFKEVNSQRSLEFLVLKMILSNQVSSEVLTTLVLKYE